MPLPPDRPAHLTSAPPARPGRRRRELDRAGAFLAALAVAAAVGAARPRTQVVAEPPLMEQIFPPDTELLERMLAKEQALLALAGRQRTLLETARLFRD